MRSEAGFTLVEVVVALAVTTLIAAGVHGALSGMTKIARIEKSDSRLAMERLRAIEIVRRDVRGRLKMRVKPPPQDQDGPGVLVLATTADSLDARGGDREAQEVRYTATAEGLRRVEVSSRGLSEILLSPDPASMEFLSGGVWRPRGGGAITAVRVNFTRPVESVVIR